jgi:hypothetical protein
MGPTENMGPTGKVWYHALASMRGENWIWFETGFRSGSGLVSVESSRGVALNTVNQSFSVS